jgi:ribosomal protein eS8
VVRKVRVRGGTHKLRALRLDHGNFTWPGECVARKTRILSVVYNATSNELVRTNTLVKSCIVQIDATPFKVWYQKWYNVLLAKPKEEKAADKKAAEKKAGVEKKGTDKKGADKKGTDKKGGEKRKLGQSKRDIRKIVSPTARSNLTLRQWKAELKARKEIKGKIAKKKPAATAKPDDKKAALAKKGAAGKKAEPKKAAGKKAEPAKKGAAAKKAEPKKAAAAEPGKKVDTTGKPAVQLKKKVPHIEKDPTQTSKTFKHKMEVRNKRRLLEPALADQFKTGRLYARITSRPGQCGRADGLVLEGEELAFYIKKILGHKKRKV